MPRKPNSPRDDPEQSKRFIEAARKVDASEDEADFDKALKRVAKPKPEAKKNGH